MCRRGCSPHPGLAQPRPRQLCAESSAEAGGARPPPGARGLVGLPNFWRNGPWVSKVPGEHHVFTEVQSPVLDIMGVPKHGS